MNMQIWSMFGIVQIVFAMIIGMYVLNLMQNQRRQKQAIQKNDIRGQEKLSAMRKVRLTEPLTAKTRPASFADVIGQEEGIKALRAAMCGPNPQHVILYGPPGIGKTTVARLILEEAKQMPQSAFAPDAVFVEVDGATSRFDERGIADPLIGTVHDPIYQGAGAMGSAGIPQPKPGAVTKAHGGVLYIDEIGELHPMQINKLLKVLEDRKVLLESAYYSKENTRIPKHIHDIFQNGLPADFRLIAATTRQPQEIPAAIRSRCLEIYFRSLYPQEIITVAANAAERIEKKIGMPALEFLSQYASNGREAVNMVQIAAGMAITENRNEIQKEDLEWVVDSCHYTPKMRSDVAEKPSIGFVNALVVYGANVGLVHGIEVVASFAVETKGKIRITGVAEKEELQGPGGQKIWRKSMVCCSVENVCTVLKMIYHVDVERYDIHINFSGGAPMDGPSAGIAIAVAMYSAICKKVIDHRVAMTGELSIRGNVLPVGGVTEKLNAAREAGIQKVFLPRKNWQSVFSQKMDMEVIPIETVDQVFAFMGLLPEQERHFIG